MTTLDDSTSANPLVSARCQPRIAPVQRERYNSGKIDSATAERRRLVDLFQAGLIEMPELQRRSREVAARHDELTTKRGSLAAERTALTQGNQLRRRVNDFSHQIRGVIDQLDPPQRQHLMRLLIEDVHVTGSHVEI